MLSVRDVEDVYLLARAKFEQWRDQFEREYYSDVFSTYANMGISMVENLPDDLKAYSRQINPDAWEKLEK